MDECEALVWEDVLSKALEASSRAFQSHNNVFDAMFKLLGESKLTSYVFFFDDHLQITHDHWSFL